MSSLRRLEPEVPPRSSRAASTPAPTDSVAPTADAAVWTCPYCPLLCDTARVRCGASAQDAPPVLDGLDCPLAVAALADAWHGVAPDASPPGDGRGGPSPRLDGQPLPWPEALALAARWLDAARQPLLGGLGTDVAGMRTLYRLACATGAISDAAAGEALSQGLRAHQDRGGYTTTLAEVRERADLIVLVGSWAPQRAPLLLPRLIDGRDEPPVLVLLGDEGGPPPGTVRVGERELPLLHVPLAGDLFDTLAHLLLLLGDRPGAAAAAPAPLVPLATRMAAAASVVLVWEPSRLGPHAGLLIERLQLLIGRLNRRGHAAGLPISGGHGAMTAQYVHAWLSGLPLRTRVGPLGLEHDPLRYDAHRLIAAGETDLLLWVDSWRAAPVPTHPGLRRIVLGVPAQAARLAGAPGTLFLPVATPGLETGGHLFRADSSVLLPLHPVPGWPGRGLRPVAAVVTALLERLAPPAVVQPGGAA
ncbi:formylmethanofuran dehydrogenase subunit B [Sphaerotilus hippei]|uniref:Formylmethanofuran dehydrogenase subunit B n=1 Tax=Sphaerotilus hippei TaxID=744406 RepID=A0A318GU02_9BURK|nr:formylmethanofuran dehydrogenase [Sphaerotilus hippei]PXW91564.1 formylmethanofuran dehydrogenase subunit B [Sphaerotilus hippei]